MLITLFRDQVQAYNAKMFMTEPVRGRNREQISLSLNNMILTTRNTTLGFAPWTLIIDTSLSAHRARVIETQSAREHGLLGLTTSVYRTLVFGASPMFVINNRRSTLAFVPTTLVTSAKLCVFSQRRTTDKSTLMPSAVL